MVQRTSKYKTNRKITKHSSHFIDDYTMWSEQYEANQAPSNDDVNAYCSKDFTFKGKNGPEYRCYTDDQHFETIDRRERKKVYNKIKQNKLLHEDEKNEQDVQIPYNLYLKSELVHPESNPEDVEVDEEIKYQRKIAAREDAKKYRKVYKLPDNINRSLMYTKVSNVVNIPANKLRKFFVKNENTKHCLYNGDHKSFHWDSGLYDKRMTKHTKKKEFVKEVNYEMTTIKEHTNKLS